MLHDSQSSAGGIVRPVVPDSEWDRLLGVYTGPWTYRSPRAPGGEIVYRAEVTFSRVPGRERTLHRLMVLRAGPMTITTEAEVVYAEDGSFQAFRDGHLISTGRCVFNEWQATCLDTYHKRPNDRGITAWGGQTLIFTGDEYDMAGQGKEESCGADGACVQNDYFYRAGLTRRR